MEKKYKITSTSGEFICLYDGDMSHAVKWMRLFGATKIIISVFEE